MDANDLRSKSETQLQELLRRKRAEVQSLRFALAGGRVKQIHQLHDAKRTVARILTILNERR